jgi:transitional endoplasmic reticulum ATPase
MPVWANEVVKKWQAGIAHVFLLHGNTGDTVDGINTVQSYLMNKFDLCHAREIIVQYDRSSGITFPLATHRAAFYKAIGMDVPEDDYDFDLPRDPVGALRLIERVLPLTMDGPNETSMPKTTVIISFAETIAPANDVSGMSSEDRTVLVTLQRWAREPEFTHIGPPVFLIAENLSDINPALRSASSRIEAVEIPYPNIEERLKYIKWFSASQKVAVENVEQAAAMTAGLKRNHIEDIVLRAKSLGLTVDASLIKARKDEIVRAEFAEVLELMDPEHGFEVIGGMENVKDFFRRNIINPIKSGNLRRVPLGVLLPGPPGTGKTALAQCVAKESGLNCAALNLSKIFNQWVGSSERNLDKAFSCLEALAPCLVIVDEIDQSGLNRENSGDSGVSNRLFKRLLEFMSDTRHRGRIVFVGLTNRPDLMDPALKRPGRFDKKIPVLPPSEEERQDIFKVMFTKYNIAYEVDLVNAAAQTNDYTGAEIEALVLKSLEVAEDAGSDVVTDEHLAHALEAYVPTTRDIQQQVRLALAECNDRDLLPPAYRHMLDERKDSKPVPAMRTVRSMN